MTLKNTIASSFFGFLFSLAILFPSIVQFTHLFEAHDNMACAETVQHIHEKKIECEIHNFQIAPFNFYTFGGLNTLIITSYSVENEQVTSLFHSEKTHDFLLRAPPTLS